MIPCCDLVCEQAILMFFIVLLIVLHTSVPKKMWFLSQEISIVEVEEYWSPAVHCMSILANMLACESKSHFCILRNPLTQIFSSFFLAVLTLMHASLQS